MSTETEAAAGVDITFPVTGMTCASCVRRIEKALSKVEGVQQASVNRATEKAHVVYDPSLASLERLTAAVEKAGYKIGAKPTVAATYVAMGLLYPLFGVLLNPCARRRGDGHEQRQRGHQRFAPAPLQAARISRGYLASTPARARCGLRLPGGYRPGCAGDWPRSAGVCTQRNGYAVVIGGGKRCRHIDFQFSVLRRTATIWQQRF